MARVNPETENAGKRWPEDEKRRLIEQLEAGQSYEDIARAHKRSPLSVRCQVLQHLYEKDIVDHTIYDRYKISPEEMIAYREKKEGMIERKKFRKDAAKLVTRKQLISCMDDYVRLESLRTIEKLVDFLKTKIEFDEDMQGFFDDFKDELVRA